MIAMLECLCILLKPLIQCIQYELSPVLIETCFMQTTDQGPVVLSIASLTTPLRHQLLHYMLTTLSNTLFIFCYTNVRIVGYLTVYCMGIFA